MAWQSLHVYYYDDEFDTLILDAVRPLFDRLADHVPRAYFVRHWKRGPHLRLNFATGSEQEFRELVRPAADDIVGGYLAAHPSTVNPDPTALLPMHEQLARFEGEAGPLLPWYPNNSIQAGCQHDRLPVLGSQDAVDLLADFYVGSTDISFRMIDRVRTSGSRMGIALDLMLATAHVYVEGAISSGCVSFRSHAEAFLNGMPEGPVLRPGWDRQYDQHSERLVRRVAAVVATVDGERESLDGQVPFVREWLAGLEQIARRGAALIEQGRITLDPPQPGPGGTSTIGTIATVAESSRFHQVLENTAWWRENREASWFLLYRLMLNYTYLHLTRLGIKPVERFMLCHFAANAIEQAYGVSAMELVSK